MWHHQFKKLLWTFVVLPLNSGYAPEILWKKKFHSVSFLLKTLEWRLFLKIFVNLCVYMCLCVYIFLYYICLYMFILSIYVYVFLYIYVFTWVHVARPTSYLSKNFGRPKCWSSEVPYQSCPISNCPTFQTVDIFFSLVREPTCPSYLLNLFYDIFKSFLTFIMTEFRVLDNMSSLPIYM